MTQPLISVIIPVYNPGKHITVCLNSIVNQSYKNLEIILVDDGSTDGSSELCDEWAKKDGRIKVIHKTNGGAASARNAGLVCSSGELIGFIDSDDFIDTDMYEAMLNDIKQNNVDAARCGIDRVFENGTVDDWGSGDTTVLVVDQKQLLKDIGAAEGILPVSPCNKLFKRECIGNIRFDTRFNFAEDTLFNFMVAQNIHKMVYHDVNYYHYTNNSDSMTNKGINENNFDEHRVMDVVFGLADDETMPYCVKGDVLKSFRTLRQIAESGCYIERFNDIRKRIIENRKAILHSDIYSIATKAKTVLLSISPILYRFIVKNYSNLKYRKKREK